MVRKKKLKKSDINKNNSIEISGSINKLKSQEAKYTLFLVMFFMIIFCIIGYNTLSFNDKVMIYGKSNDTSDDYISSKSELVTLTENNVLSDEAGLLSKNINVEIENGSDFELNYRIVFKQDDNIVLSCGCLDKKMDSSLIKFSIDGEKIQQLDGEMVITEGRLEPSKNIVIPVKMWVSEEASNKDLHFHGHFVLEEL